MEAFQCLVANYYNIEMLRFPTGRRLASWLFTKCGSNGFNWDQLGPDYRRQYHSSLRYSQEAFHLGPLDYKSSALTTSKTNPALLYHGNFKFSYRAGNGNPLTLLERASYS